MKALILCAGLGMRMRPLSQKIPKCLIEINGTTVLKRLLDQLSSKGFTDAYLVVGYKKQLIVDAFGKHHNKLKIHYVDNPFHAKLNNLFSVWLGKPYLYGEDFFLINGDIVIDDNILDQALNTSLKNFCVIDCAQPLPEDSMKVKIKNELIVDFGKDLKKGTGCTVGIHRYSGSGSLVFFDELGDMLEQQKDDFHHAALLNIIKKYEFKHSALCINDTWQELDEVNDIEQAKQKFS